MTTTESKDNPRIVEVTDAPPKLDPEVAKYRRFFNKPVAVQLTGPYISVGCAYSDRGDGLLPLVMAGHGMPKLSLVEGAPMPLVVLIGSLRPSEDGPQLLFCHETEPYGSIAEILLDPKYIALVTAIVGPVAPPAQPEPSRIISPN